MKFDLDTFKLCYICERRGFAYFTQIDLKDQWGDDWNDAPYEHNASEPYEYRYINKEFIPHHLLKVAWEGPFNTPAQVAGGNSCWSVEGINKGCIAWLIPDKWDVGSDVKPIHAGTTLPTFTNQIEASGGVVYIPRFIIDECSKIP